MLESEQIEREALGEYKCDAGMSVEDVAVIVNMKTLKGRLIAGNVLLQFSRLRFEISRLRLRFLAG